MINDNSQTCLQYIKMLRGQITLNEAVERVYDGKVRPVVEISSNWFMFEPYKINRKSVAYFRLLQISNQYNTSEEIYRKGLKKKFVHQIELMLVERCFKYSYYLVKTNQNIISIRNLIELNKEANQKIHIEIIYQFLNFASKTLKQGPKCSLNLDEIGLTNNRKFILTKYHLYFKSSKNQPNTLRQDVQKILASMILLRTNQKYTIEELFSECQEFYGETLLDVIKRSIQLNFTSDLVPNYANEENNDLAYERKTTLTDSFHEVEKNEQIPSKVLEDSMVSDTLTQTFVESKGKTPMSKEKKTVFLVFFLVLLVASVYVALRFLVPKEIVCGKGEYVDQQQTKCLACASGCEKCFAGGFTECLSCQQGKVLVINDSKLLKGSCAETCDGVYLSEKICFDPTL